MKWNFSLARVGELICNCRGNWENLEIEIVILLCCLKLISKLAAGPKKYKQHRVVSMFGIAHYSWSIQSRHAYCTVGMANYWSNSNADSPKKNVDLVIKLTTTNPGHT